MKKKLTWAGMQTLHQHGCENYPNIYCFIFLSSWFYSKIFTNFFYPLWYNVPKCYRGLRPPIKNLHWCCDCVDVCILSMEPRARCVMDHCVGNVGDASNLILIQFFRFPPAKTWSLASINIQFLFQTARMTCVRAGGCHYHRHPHHHHYHPPARASVTPAGPCSGRTDKCAWTASMVSSHRMMPGHICLMILTSSSQNARWPTLSREAARKRSRSCSSPWRASSSTPGSYIYSQSEKVFDVGNWDLSSSLWWNNFVILTKLRH